jgi:hypothetical protein
MFAGSNVQSTERGLVTLKMDSDTPFLVLDTGYLGQHLLSVEAAKTTEQKMLTN